MKNFIFIMLFLISFNGVAQFTPQQQKELDSLSAIINNSESHDTLVVLTYFEIANYYYLNNPDTAITIYKRALQLSNSIKYKYGRLKAYQWLEYLFSMKGEIELALEYCNKQLKLHEESNDQIGIAKALSSIGMTYINMGEINLGIEFYNKALTFQKKTNDKSAMVDTYQSLGLVKENIGDLASALDYYYKSLTISQQLDNQFDLATSFQWIGALYVKLGNDSLALMYFRRSLDSFNKLEDKSGIGMVYDRLGVLHFQNKNYSLSLKNIKESLSYYIEVGDKSGEAEAYGSLGRFYSNNIQNVGNVDLGLEYYQKAIEILEEINEYQRLIATYWNIGLAHFDFGDKKQANIYLKKSLKLSEKINDYWLRSKCYFVLGKIANENGVYHGKNGALTLATNSLEFAKKNNSPKDIKLASELLSKIYEKLGNYKLSLEMHKLSIVMKDSLKNINIQTEAVKQQSRYEYEKRKALDDKENEKLVALEKQKQKEQFIVLVIVIIAASLVAILLIIIYRRLKLTRKQKIIIEEQKEEVESQRDAIEHQKEIVEEAHQEIKDSINYAKRIQSAILPASSIIKQALPESFIYYQPKDVVAGDFYWLEVVKDKVLIAAADCTGHGVPGAMVSVVCNNAMNRAVREYDLTDVGAILDKTREIVIQEFEKSEEDVKDGMDIALCSLEGKKLQYAGAHNPLWIIRKGELLETKANKQPIGQFDNPEPYTTHSFELQKGDSIYIFSDGYQDQFGGEKDKKFGTKRFKNLLLSIQEKSIIQQNEILNSTFENWMKESNAEQIDDVCVIGVRV